MGVNKPFWALVSKASYQERKLSRHELWTLFFFSWSPVLFEGVIKWLAAGESLPVAIYNILSSGQVYIYIAAIIGSLVYLIKDFDEKVRHFPCGGSLNLYTILILSITLIIFVLDRTNQLHGSKLSTFIVSMIVYAVSVYMWWISILYRNIAPEKFVAFAEKAAEEQEKIAKDLDGFVG